MEIWHPPIQGHVAEAHEAQQAKQSDNFTQYVKRGAYTHRWSEQGAGQNTDNVSDSHWNKQCQYKTH